MTVVQKRKTEVLLIEDDRSQAALITKMLSECAHEFSMQHSRSLADGLGQLAKREFDITRLCLLLITILMASGCGSMRPVLFPNDHLKQVGQVKADQDTDGCIQMAKDYKADSDKAKEIAKDTGKMAAVGAATGAVIGAITGDAGVGAAIGGAGGGTAALGAGLMRSDQPDPVFRQFVEQCLREKGYQPIGWK